jgi:hypothetical protein
VVSVIIDSFYCPDLSKIGTDYTWVVVETGCWEGVGFPEGFPFDGKPLFSEEFLGCRFCWEKSE